MSKTTFQKFRLMPVDENNNNSAEPYLVPFASSAYENFAPPGGGVVAKGELEMYENEPALHKKNVTTYENDPVSNSAPTYENETSSSFIPPPPRPLRHKKKKKKIDIPIYEKEAPPPPLPIPQVDDGKSNKRKFLASFRKPKNTPPPAKNLPVIAEEVRRSTKKKTAPRPPPITKMLSSYHDRQKIPLPSKPNINIIRKK